MLNKKEKKIFKKVRKLIKLHGIRRVNYDLSKYYCNYKDSFVGAVSLHISFDKFNDCTCIIKVLAKEKLYFDYSYKKGNEYCLEYILDDIN